MGRILLRAPSPTPTAATAVGKGVARLHTTYDRAEALVATAAIAVALFGAWAGSIVMGGSRSPGPHLFYIAVILAAVRFTWPAVIATSMCAGLLAGPLLPADVSSGVAQQPHAWLFRLAMFTAIGLLVALLRGGSEATPRRRLEDALTSARLLRAIKSGAIEVVYQPIYRLADHQLVCVEALVRWRRSNHRYAGPERFIPSAERTGAIVKLDGFVLREAAAAARVWANSARPISVSVNLSAVTLTHLPIAQTVERLLAEVGLPARYLQLEITESALVDDLPAAIRQVEAVRALGVKMAIDDFGSGQASLNYLQCFPVDVLKLDRSIVTAAVIDDRSRRLIEAVVHMANLLDLEVIAEGVEFADQLSLLRTVDIPMAQGFLLGVPAAAGDVQALIDAASPR